jgi:hypothetical protein
MANSAIVIGFGRLGRPGRKRNRTKNRGLPEEPFVSRNHILVPVVGKLDFELPLPNRISKFVSSISAGRYCRVTDGADDWPRSPKELLPVTTHAGAMVRIVGDVGVITRLLPIQGRRLMTVVTGTLVFVS